MISLARIVLAVTVLTILLALGGSATAAPTRYAAVAYSPSTGAYGYANGYDTKEGAIARAKAECGESDAVAKWARNAWLALAISADGGYGSGWATTAAKARQMAIESCLEHNDDAKVVVCVNAYR